MESIKNVLISDDIDKICIQILEGSGIKVEVNTKLTKDQLKEKIKEFDALIVRSSTKVTKDVILAGDRLKLIGRAGTGVDNIDTYAATENGIIVMNTPMGNSRSVAELTSAMIISLSRRIPLADASMKNEKWDRKAFMGSEVHGKTLAIVGLGRIGREVASRMRAFGMRTIGYDPIINAEQSKSFNVEWMPLEKIWPEADYITVHVPLIPETERLINASTFSKCKPTVCVINSARGGIIDENDLVKALNEGKCAGAALDVFVEEPPKNFDLIKHPKVICTPHMGASTVEAQQRVAQEIAEQFVAYNRQEALNGAVNAQAMVACFDKTVGHVVRNVTDGAKLLHALCTKAATISVEVPSGISKSAESAIVGATVAGYLSHDSKKKINLVNAQSIGKASGIKVTVKFLQASVPITLRASESTSGSISVSVSGNATSTSLVAINEKPFGNPVLLKDLIAIYSCNVETKTKLISELSQKNKCLAISRQIDQAEPLHIAATFQFVNEDELAVSGHKPSWVLF